MLDAPYCLLQFFEIGVQNHEIIRIAHQQWLFPGMTVGKAFCDHRFHPMQRDIHEQRREHTSLSYPRFAGGVGVAIHHPRSEPGVDGLPERGKGL